MNKGVSNANKRQVGGNHYKVNGLQHWDICGYLRLNYFEGQITKYVSRWKNKNGKQDLEKALHFAEKLLEMRNDGWLTCVRHFDVSREDLIKEYFDAHNFDGDQQQIQRLVFNWETVEQLERLVSMIKEYINTGRNISVGSKKCLPI